MASGQTGISQLPFRIELLDADTAHKVEMYGFKMRDGTRVDASPAVGAGHSKKNKTALTENTADEKSPNAGPDTCGEAKAPSSTSGSQLTNEANRSQEANTTDSMGR